MSARFDDLTPHGQSFVLSDPVEEFVARQPDQVVNVLRAAENASRRGRWVAGFVTYEAAPGLDPSLPAQQWSTDHPLGTLPLVWFAAFARRDEVDACQPDEAGEQDLDWRLDRDQDWHRNAVDRVQRMIADGDFYQLNLTLRLAGKVADPTELYPRLAAAQSGAHNALLVTPDHTIVSASPELFFTRTGNEIVTRPMKGTAARGRWPAEDAQQARTLLGSAKERAENVMIVDLLRNDLGRVAEVGSVEVPALLTAERYPTLWQLTSTVAARVPPEVDLAALFGALFPSGSITGAPKRRTMQAIAEIEQRPRGVYCGAIGYLTPDRIRAAAQFSVAIRTITVSHQSCHAEYGTGGGITASSDPDAEWAELLTKTAVLRRPPRPNGLIETLRFEPPQRFVNLDQHLDRLGSSADYFEFRCDQTTVRTALTASLTHRDTPARVQITLTPSGEVSIRVEDLPPAQTLVRVGLAERPVDSTDVLLFHKQTDRSRYDRARRSFADLDDVLLWNERGQLTEATTANLAVRLEDRWWTPSLSCGLLPGVERGRLLAAGVLAERDIAVDELPAAQGLALINSLRGWRPAVLHQEVKQ